VLALLMLLGRLDIVPMLLLFAGLTSRASRRSVPPTSAGSARPSRAGHD
jgi:Trk-type K+ transport system membrane component